MERYGKRGQVADGYTLSTPPTVDQINAVEERMRSYATNGQLGLLSRLGDRLCSFSEELANPSKGIPHPQSAQVILELADVARNSMADLQNGF